MNFWLMFGYGILAAIGLRFAINETDKKGHDSAVRLAVAIAVEIALAALGAMLAVWSLLRLVQGMQL